MAETVGNHSVAAFANPSNGDNLDATVVKGNDNTLRVGYVAHDADGGIHLQSSALASRPAAGTPGRKWLTTDSGAVRLYYDTGSTWVEATYAVSGTNTSLTNLDVSGTLTVAGATTINDTFDVVGNATIDGTLAVSGAVTAASFSGAATGLTSIPAANLTGTAAAINGSNITALNGSNIASGTVAAARLPTSYSALTITTLTSTTIQGAASSPRNVINLGDSAFEFVVLSSSSALWANGNGAGNVFAANISGPTGSVAVSGVRWIACSINSVTCWIPALTF